MDGHRFDDMTKALVRATPSRRGVLRGLAGAVGAIAAAGLGRASAQDVAPDATDLICDNQPVLCNKQGVPAASCLKPECRCGKTRNGDKKCVVVGGATCQNRQACRGNRDCERGEVCVLVEGCRDCGNKSGRCFKRCR